MDPLDLPDLRAFLAVAEAGSFHRAARRLHVSQPPLSRRIRGLEDSLQVRLFARGRAGARLTDEGEALLGRAREVLARADDAVAEVRAIAAGQAGRLKIGYTDDFQYGPFAQVVADLIRQGPKLTLALMQADSAPLVQRVAEGEVDLALVSTPLPSNFSQVGAAILGRTPLWALVSASDTPARSLPMPLSAFRDHKFIFGKLLPTSGYYIQVMGCFQRADFTPQIIQDVAPSEMIANVVSAGGGVSLVTADSVYNGRTDVVLIPLDDPDASIERAVIWRRPEPSTLALRVISIIVDCFRHERSESVGARSATTSRRTSVAKRSDSDRDDQMTQERRR